MTTEGTLKKTVNGYVWDSGDIFTWEKHYNNNGEYIGQVQDNILDSEGTIFLNPEYINGKPCVNGVPVPNLTQEQMQNAKD